MSNSAIFDPPNDFMKNHLKPLFLSGRVNGYFINQMLVDGGAAINLIPKGSLKKLGKKEEDLFPRNIVITDFNGKTSKSDGTIALGIEVGDVIRHTVFIVVPSIANYNMLLGREWIDGVGVVPSNLHQKLFLWNEEGDLREVEADYTQVKANTRSVEYDKFFENMAPLRIEDPSSTKE
ncbi:Aspartic peptidase domain superfamily [Sesbania bispinosa]|nr:Aspartic peptidase domain superfamily [Sesbania bispinosa]